MKLEELEAQAEELVEPDPGFIIKLRECADRSMALLRHDDPAVAWLHAQWTGGMRAMHELASNQQASLVLMTHFKGIAACMLIVQGECARMYVECADHMHDTSHKIVDLDQQIELQRARDGGQIN